LKLWKLVKKNPLAPSKQRLRKLALKIRSFVPAPTIFKPIILSMSDLFANDRASSDEYVLDEIKVSEEIKESGDSLAVLLMYSFQTDMASAVDACSEWAEHCAQGTPERRWGGLQASAAFTRGMLHDAGASTESISEAGTVEQGTPEDIGEGITDAFTIATLPGEPEMVLSDEWLIYADKDNCSEDQYTSALLTLFLLAVAAAPEAAKKVT